MNTKKLLSLFIALAMVVSFTLPAWAAGEESDNPEESSDEFNIATTKKIERKSNSDLKTEYKVGEKLDLSNLVLTFTDENEKTKDFTYEELKDMGFTFKLCDADYDPKAEELAKVKEEAKEEVDKLENLNESEKAEFKKAIEDAKDEEEVKKIKAEAELKNEFAGIADDKFSDISTKEGVYTGSYNKETRTVNISIEDKDASFEHIKGTGLIAALFSSQGFDLIKSFQIGSQDEIPFSNIKEIDESQQMAALKQLLMLSIGQELNPDHDPNKSIKNLGALIDKQIELKLTLEKDGVETTIIYTIKGLDGTTEEPAPAEGGGSEDETTTPAGTCTAIDQMNALELEDNGKNIIINGPQTLTDVDSVPDLIKYLNFTVASITVTEEPEQPSEPDQPGTDEPGEDPYEPSYPSYPGYRYEPSPDYLRDYSKKDDYKPAERKEDKKEEVKEEETKDIFKTLYFYLDKGFYEMEVNGEIQQIPMDVAPTAINQRTMLPIRFVAEAIGATVEWHQDTQSATFTKDGITATITLGSNIIQVSDGRQIVMDAEPTVISERIFVPLTNISQIFGMTNGDLRDGADNDIEWDQENYRVIITVREN